MRLILTSSIGLFASISPSLGHPFDMYHRSKQVPSCHYPTLGLNTYIYFTSPNESDFEFAIGTPFTETYPNVLRSALSKHGFSPAENPATNSSNLCGWQDVAQIYVNYIHHGDISYKYNPTQPQAMRQHQNGREFNSAMKTLHINTPQKFVSLRQPAPRNGSLNQIRDIVRASYPTYDLIMLILEITTPILILVLLVSLIQWIIDRVDKKSCKPGDIELVSIQGQSVTSLALNEGTDPFVDPQPPADVKSKDRALLETPAKVSKPSPMSLYTMDVAGR